ncbi:MAG TPA: hypothetical protein VMT97_19040 [Terriglobales bacterium]|nr:hypothetical protein [Terriglobales bacterium]
MDPGTLPRLRAWLERSEIVALDPRRIEALALTLADADPPVRVERWGTVVGYEAGPPRRRLVQFDRHGHLIAACHWKLDGSLGWARCRSADGRWIGVEPGADEHPAWGESDRVWLLDGEEPWRPVEPLSVFRALDWSRLDHIPPLAEPRRLPPGAGSAVLNLLASLMKDQGLARARYRGPFPSEQLFTSLLESFRHDPAQTLPLERFLADGGLDWLPAPFESHQVAAWVTVQLRQHIDKVVADGVTFYRSEWQGIKRREPRVIRDEAERVVCSLWALGGPLEDRLTLDPSGEILDAPPARAPEVPPAPLPPVWNSALGDLISRESAPALGPAIVEVLHETPLEWGAVPGDLMRPWEKRIRLSARLREAATASLRSAAPGRERAEQALRFVLEVARLLGPEIRGRAQALLEALPEEEQARRLGRAAEESEALDESVGRLIALLAR